MESKKELMRCYKKLRADLAEYLPRLSVLDILALNRASVTIRRIERETEAEMAQEGGNNVNSIL